MGQASTDFCGLFEPEFLFIVFRVLEYLIISISKAYFKLNINSLTVLFMNLCEGPGVNLSPGV